MLCGFNLHRSYSWGHNYHDFIHTTTLSCPENVVSLRSTISGSSKMMLELWEERVGLRHMSHSGLSILMSLSLCTLTSCESVPWPVVNLDQLWILNSCESLYLDQLWISVQEFIPFFFSSFLWLLLISELDGHPIVYYLALLFVCIYQSFKSLSRFSTVSLVIATTIFISKDSFFHLSSL